MTAPREGISPLLVAAREAFDYLRKAPSDALNSVWVRGPLGGLSGWNVMQIAEHEGWGKWEGEHVSH